MIEQQRVSVNPANTLGAESLEIALQYQLAAKVIQVQVGMETGSEDQHLIELDHCHLLLHLIDAGICFEGHVPHLVDSLDKVVLVFAVRNHVLKNGLHEEDISL